MGTYGNIVLYPLPAVKRGFLRSRYEIPAAAAKPQDLVARVVQLFADHGFLSVDAQSVSLDAPPQVFSRHAVPRPVPSEMTMSGAQIAPMQLSERIGELVFTATEREFYEDIPEEELSDNRYVPWVDISVLDRVVEVRSDRAKIHSWAFIEFFYHDMRLTDKIHRLRAPNHPFIAALPEILKAEVSAGVIPY